jgi:hypothetical protein
MKLLHFKNNNNLIIYNNNLIMKYLASKELYPIAFNLVVDFNDKDNDNSNNNSNNNNIFSIST